MQSLTDRELVERDRLRFVAHATAGRSLPITPNPVQAVDFLWCGRGDLNSHVLTDNRF